MPLAEALLVKPIVEGAEGSYLPNCQTNLAFLKQVVRRSELILLVNVARFWPNFDRIWKKFEDPFKILNLLWKKVLRQLFKVEVRNV